MICAISTDAAALWFPRRASAREHRAIDTDSAGLKCITASAQQPKQVLSSIAQRLY
jgi:hypothetical protein